MPGMVMVAIVVFVAMSWQFYGRVSDASKFGTEEYHIGEVQSLLKDVYYEAEKDLLYIDQAAKLAGNGAIFILAEKGGLYNTGCGTVRNYSLWSNNDKECYPNTVNNFGSVFNDIIKKYSITKFPSKYSLVIKNSADETIVSGIAADTLEYNTHFGATYVLKPSINTNIRFKMPVFGALIAKVKAMKTTCSSILDEDELKKCVWDFVAGIESDEFMLKIAGSDERTFLFDAVVKNKLQGRDVVIKFGVNFPGQIMNQK